MQKFVHSYLSASFVIRKTETNKGGKLTIFGFDAIFPKSNGEIETSFIYGSKLIKELVLAAYVDEVRLRKYVNEWVKINYPEADLQLYWLQLEPRLPLLAQELVAVEPMDNPTGGLLYLDFSYDNNTDTPNQNGRVYNQEVFGEKMAQIIRNQVNHLINESDHKEPPIFISSKTKKDLDNTE